MPLKFITSNKTKVKEFNIALSPLKVQQINIDLEEIQSLDPYKIIRHKLQQAFKHHSGELIVEDSSMFMSALGGKLPGPLIKHFNESLGNNGLYEIAKKLGKNKAQAITIIGYAKNPKQILFFEGHLQGKIVKPKGKYLFGYDSIFMPKEKNQTLSELKDLKKFNLSPRGIAVKKLKRYLTSK